MKGTKDYYRTEIIKLIQNYDDITVIIFIYKLLHNRAAQ